MSKTLPPPVVTNRTGQHVPSPSSAQLFQIARGFQRQHYADAARGTLSTDSAVAPFVDPARAALRAHVKMIADAAEKAGNRLHPHCVQDLNIAIGEKMGLRVDEQRQRIDYTMYADNSTAPRSRTQEATTLTRQMEPPNTLSEVFPVRAIGLDKDQYADLYQAESGKAAPIQPGQTEVPTVSYELGENLHRMHWIGAATKQDWYYGLVGDAPDSIVNKAAEEARLAIKSINDVYDDGLREGLAGLDFRGVGQLECNVVVSTLDWTTADINQRITEAIRLVNESIRRNGKAGVYSIAHFDWEVDAEFSRTTNLGAGGNQTGIDTVLDAMRQRGVSQRLVHFKGLGPSPFGADRRRILLAMPNAIQRPVSFAPAPVYTSEVQGGRYTLFAGCFGGLSLAQKLGACILDVKVL